MDILIAAGSGMQPAPAGQVTLFIDTDNSNILSFIDSAGVIKLYNSGNSSELEECCSCEIAKAWINAVTCAMKSGKLDATEFGVIMAQGLTVTNVESTDPVTGAKTCTVNIGPKVVDTIAVTGIVVSGDNTVATGFTRQYTAAITPVTATNQALLWVSSNPAIATVNAVGLITGVSAGTCTIFAYSQSNPSVFGSRAITVS
jgi:hypothetical protein